MKQKSWTPLGRDSNPHHVDLINLKKFKDYFFRQLFSCLNKLKFWKIISFVGLLVCLLLWMQKKKIKNRNYQSKNFEDLNQNWISCCWARFIFGILIWKKNKIGRCKITFVILWSFILNVNAISKSISHHLAGLGLVYWFGHYCF